ncbi:amidohydrolase [Labilibacter marinus]|uniref:amidohydrolase n=1 Tax=Labilibacter marinus TaxID=1477105 RepID=UPI0009500F84|nr:amidohydrolase [Labilibacter marinus]
MQLNIALLQYNIIWENVKDNLKYLSDLLQSLPHEVDLVVLPEMFATGFSMNVDEVAEPMDGEVCAWMKKIAKLHDVALMGTQAIRDKGIYNRALLVHSNGDIDHYDKRHLFSPGGEDNKYSKGRERRIFMLNGVRILPQICYDLRFPVWSRNIGDYDVAIYMANWPAARQSVWDALLIARAIENQSYTIGVNRVGVGNQIVYSGGSRCIDFKGQIIKDVSNLEGIVEIQEFDIKKQNVFRSKFSALQDGDDFELLL